MTVNVDGTRIRHLRLDRSWSQESLAERAGVSLRTIQRMETEGVASLQSRRAVAEALEVPASELGKPNSVSGGRDSDAGRRDAAAVSSEGRPLSRKALLTLAASCAMAIIVACGAYYGMAQQDEATNEHGPRVVTIDYGDVNGPISAVGVPWAGEVSTVHVNAVGRPAELHVEPGDRVEEGQLLALIDGREVRAPMSGTIVSLDPREGAVVSGTQTAPLVMEIHDFETMTVQTEIPEAVVAALEIGMDAYVTTFRGGDRRWSGNLTRVEPLPGKAGAYPGHIDVDNPDGALRAGTTAQVFLETGSAQNVLTVPVGALRYAANSAGGRNRTVQIALPDGTTDTREIVIGAIDAVNAEVVSGLAQGDRVITRSVER